MGHSGDQVLRCGRCNKPFDKEFTLRRHGYYCRSRRLGIAPPARPRSCVACARAKTGCDHQRPGCSRCASKDIACHYPESPRKQAESPGPHPVGGSPAAWETALLQTAEPASLGQSPDTVGASMAVDGVLTLSNAGAATLGDGYLGWDQPNISFADFLAMPAPSSPALSIPREINTAVRTLTYRPKRQPGAQRVANLILHTLRSYPHMMLRHHALPPFIHPGLASSGTADLSMEPLANCISIVQMISHGVRGSRKLFWKNVRMECERWEVEHDRLSRWEVLAAMQAVTIYVLIRLDEGETDDNNVDSLLVRAVTVLAQEVTQRNVTCTPQCTLCNRGLDMCWKDWVFRESRRRLAIVYRVIDMLVFFEPSSMCDLPTDLIMAPLPANRQLWEAGDEFAWKAACQNGSATQTTLALAANGGIVVIDDHQMSCGDAWLGGRSPRGGTREEASWEEWCSGMDFFGSIVMLAASLVV